MLEYHRIREEEKRIVCSWKYSGEYAVYNLPPYEEFQAKGIAFADPRQEKNFYAFQDGGELVGFVNVLEEKEEVFIGIGVKPELCGKGYGQEMLRLAAGISKKLYPGKPLYLEVRTWNKRAVRCYEKAGFVIDGDTLQQKTYAGDGQFYRMVKKD